jgi:hypothetical protein
MPDTLTVTRLLTAKSDIGRTRIETTPQACELGEGEILLRVDRFSLSANNMTYAALGETMKFWQFFRSPHAEWGHMPVWGFADVVASAVEGIELGERLYGFLPIATHVYLRPERLTQRGFYDGTEHRSELPSIYNQYTRCAADPVYLPELENIQALLRPLFTCRSCSPISCRTMRSSARAASWSRAHRARRHLERRSVLMRGMASALPASPRRRTPISCRRSDAMTRRSPMTASRQWMTACLPFTSISPATRNYARASTRISAKISSTIVLPARRQTPSF